MSYVEPKTEPDDVYLGSEPARRDAMTELTVTIDRDIAVLLKWAMHELDERSFSCASEDHKRILFAPANDLRDMLTDALALTPASPDRAAVEDAIDCYRDVCQLIGMELSRGKSRRIDDLLTTEDGRRQKLLALIFPDGSAE